VGAVSFKYLDQKGPFGNIYADKALIAAGGDPLGVLDYYQGHHYASKGEEFSPFQRDAKSFGLDKPVYVGEFNMKEYVEYEVSSPRKLYSHLKETGYHGAFGWKDGAIPAMDYMVKAISYLKYPAPMAHDADHCEHFQGGYGSPFFVNETMFRKKTVDGGSDRKDWCIVD
jgi:hypothetical protein